MSNLLQSLYDRLLILFNNQSLKEEVDTGELDDTALNDERDDIGTIAMVRSVRPRRTASRRSTAKEQRARLNLVNAHPPDARPFFGRRPLVGFWRWSRCDGTLRLLLCLIGKESLEYGAQLR